MAYAASDDSDDDDEARIEVIATMLDNVAKLLTDNAALLRRYVQAQQHEHSCMDVSMSCSEAERTELRLVYFDGRMQGMNPLDTEAVAAINRCATIYWEDWDLKVDLFDGPAPRFEFLACLMAGSSVLSLLALNTDVGIYTISDVVASFQNCGYGAMLVRAVLAKVNCVNLHGAPGPERCVLFADPTNTAACRVYRSIGSPLEERLRAPGVGLGDTELEWVRFQFGSRPGAAAAMPSPPKSPIISWSCEGPFDVASIDADVEEEGEGEASSSGGAGDSDDDYHDDDDDYR